MEAIDCYCKTCRAFIKKAEKFGKFNKAFCSVDCSIKDKTSKQNKTECWEWKGAKDKDGYAFVKFEGKQMRVTRVLTSAPKRSVVMHSCDNPSCVNPDHLKVGTVEENNRDKKEKGRDKKGLQVHGAKLTDRQVKSIFSSSKSVSSLAEKFSVTNGTIYNIKKGRTHAWLTGATYNRKTRRKQNADIN